jgi:hypothetical protein
MALGVPYCHLLRDRRITEIPCAAVSLRSTTGQHSKVQILINLPDVVVRGQW